MAIACVCLKNILPHMAPHSQLCSKTMDFMTHKLVFELAEFYQLKTNQFFSKIYFHIYTFYILLGNV